MELAREYNNFYDFIYLREDGTPRNYTEPDPGLLINATEIEIIQINLRADIEAFKKTQRWVAIGIVSIGGAFSNALDPPTNTIDFVKNLIAPTVVQLLNYATFRKGINLMRRRANERIDS